jgi:tetratricopeptide (TPR) repeat protein
MSQNESNSQDNITDTDVRTRFEQGIRDGAEMLTLSQAVRGVAGTYTLTLLTASAFIPLLPLVAAGSVSGGVVLTWLAGLGGNALAGWLASWAQRETTKLVFGDKTQEQLLIEQLAADLQSQLAGNDTLQEELVNLLDHTDSISTAIGSLYLQTETQTNLINALRGDIQHGNIIQGRLHRRIIRQLDEAEARITAKIEVESSFTRDVVHLQAEATRTRLDILPTMDTKLDLILRTLAREEVNQSKTGVEGVVEAQIAIARKLVQERHFVSGQSVLAELKEQYSQNDISPEARARIANLLGCCALAMGEFDVARTHFGEALINAPKNVGMMTNDAMAALLSAKPQEALEISGVARNLDPTNPSVASVYIQALYRLNRLEELEALLKNEHWIIENAVGAAALASIKYDLGEYQEAEVLLRRAITLDATDPQLYTLLANTILAPLAQELVEAIVFGDQTNERLKEAENVLSQAVALYEKGDNKDSLHAALVSRAGVRCIYGDLEAGLTDCERVLGENAQDRGALENKGRILLNLDRTLEAIHCFETILSQPPEGMSKTSRYQVALIGGGSSNLPMLLASVYIDTRQFDKAIKLLYPLLAPSPENREQIAIAELLLVAQTANHDNVAVADTVRIIEETWPQEPKAKAVMAEHLARQGNSLGAIKQLEEAIVLATGFLQRRLIARMAYLLHRQGKYAEAVRVLGPVVDKNHDNPDLHLYIVCLYNSQQLAEALQLTQLIRATKGVIPGVAEIEAFILEKAGDIDHAREIWHQLIEVEPSNMSHRVHAAYIEWRAGKREIARQLTFGIPFDEIKDDAGLLINTARLRAFLGLPEALAFAYRARRIAFDNPEIHVQYMMLCLTMEGVEHEDAQRAPDEVGVDTAVHLMRNGKTTTFLILDDELINKQQGELHISDPFAQKLLGRRKGDRIILHEGVLGGQEYEITEIQGKYVYASHQTTYLFEQGILRHSAFNVSDVTEPDFMERFVRFLDQRAQQQPDIKALYTQQPLPLSTFAQMIGRSIIDVWLAFVDSPTERIFSSDGTNLEAEIQMQVVASTKSIVVDLMSLLTIVHLSLEEVVIQRFDKILIPQALLDQLQEYEQELAGPQPTATVGSSGGQRYFLDIPPEYVEQKRELLDKVLAFVRNNVQVMPAMGLIETDQDFVEMLGEAATASILLAKEQNVALYSDDLRLRMVAYQQWQVKGFDSQSILSELHHRAILNKDAYYKALSKLVQSNYHFIRIDVDALIFILEQNRMEITTEVRDLFKLLHGPDCELESAVIIIAELIKRIWLRSILQHQKLFILDFALTTLFAGRRAATVVPMLKAQLWRSFRLVEFKLPEILVHIDFWGRQQSQ